MNPIYYLAALNAVALAAAGSVDYSQCNGRSALWLNPSLCTDTDQSVCSVSEILSAPSSDMNDVAWEHDEMNSLLTKFMTWASITRDVEMQRAQELCETTDETAMPWDIQTCDGDLKLVHRTQPIGEYNFDPQRKPAMSTKEPRNGKSGFGLPKEKGSASPSGMAPSARRSMINLSHGRSGNRVAVDAIEF